MSKKEVEEELEEIKMEKDKIWMMMTKNQISKRANMHRR